MPAGSVGAKRIRLTDGVAPSARVGRGGVAYVGDAHVRGAPGGLDLGLGRPVRAAGDRDG